MTAEQSTIGAAASQRLGPQHERHSISTPQAEEAERARLRREREEAHRFTFIRVATLADMKAQVGSDIFFDLVDVTKVGGARSPNESVSCYGLVGHEAACRLKATARPQACGALRCR
jgi:hypothetical protein